MGLTALADIDHAAKNSVESQPRLLTRWGAGFKEKAGKNLQELSETLQKFLTKLPGCCILLTRTGAGRSEREAVLYAAKAES